MPLIYSAGFFLRCQVAETHTSASTSRRFSSRRICHCSNCGLISSKADVKKSFFLFHFFRQIPVSSLCQSEMKHVQIHHHSFLHKQNSYPQHRSMTYIFLLCHVKKTAGKSFPAVHHTCNTLLYIFKMTGLKTFLLISITKQMAVQAILFVSLCGYLYD